MPPTWKCAIVITTKEIDIMLEAMRDNLKRDWELRLAKSRRSKRLEHAEASAMFTSTNYTSITSREICQDDHRTP